MIASTSRFGCEAGDGRAVSALWSTIRVVRARKGSGGLEGMVPLVEPVTRPVPRDAMDAHLAQVDPAPMA